LCQPKAQNPPPRDPSKNTPESNMVIAKTGDGKNRDGKISIQHLI
jgi:hypothetical protein